MYPAFFGVRLALSRFFLSMQLVSMTPSIRNLGTRYLTLSSRHTPLRSAFLRRHPIQARHPVAISASLLSVNHPRMVNPDFQA